MKTANVFILLVSQELMHTFYFAEEEAVKGKFYDAIHAGGYKLASCGVIKVTGNFAGWGFAEEMFSLTNNPARQKERELIYGNGRSLSVGDIVIVDGMAYGCAGAGWEPLYV